MIIGRDMLRPLSMTAPLLAVLACHPGDGDLEKDSVCAITARTTGPEANTDTSWGCVCEGFRIRAHSPCAGKVTFDWSPDPPATVTGVGMLAGTWDEEELRRTWICLDHEPTAEEMKGATLYPVTSGSNELTIPVTESATVFLQTTSGILYPAIVFPNDSKYCYDHLNLHD